MSRYDHISDTEVSSDQDLEAVTSSYSLGSLRMREVRVRLTDIRKMRPGLGSLPASAVKRGRGRPRKSLNQSPKITNFFSPKAALNESEQCSSDTSASEKADRRRSLLSDVNQLASGSRTPVRGSRRTSEMGDKENKENQGSEQEENVPGSLLKFVDSSGQDITMEVKVSATPEKATRKMEENDSEPEIDEEKDFNAAFDKVKNVSSFLQGDVAVDNAVVKVAVENSPSLSMDDVLQRLNQENTVDSEVEYVVKVDDDLDQEELSADDEEDMEDLPTTSTAWSSITTLMMDSPQPLLVTSLVKKKSPKKYQRSKRMSRLIDDEVTGTDTDDALETDTRLKVQRKPLVTINTTGSDDSDFEISFSNGQAPKQDCSFDDLATVIDYSNNIAPPKKETAVAVQERTEPVQQPEELEIVSDVTEKIVTEPEHTDDR